MLGYIASILSRHFPFITSKNVSSLLSKAQLPFKLRRSRTRSISTQVNTPGTHKARPEPLDVRSYFCQSSASTINNKRLAMRNGATVLTTPTVDTSGTSIILSFDDRRYLFGNIHEGLQRTCIQNGVKLAKLNNIFLTGRTEWRTTGGLMGFILTVADVIQNGIDAQKQMILEKQARWEERRAAAKSDQERQKMDASVQPKQTLAQIVKPRLEIHGGDNVMQLLATARRFIFRRGMPLDVQEHANTPSTTVPTWEDDNIQVWTMPLRPSHPVSHETPRSPRKRSFSEFLDASTPGTGTGTTVTRSEILTKVLGEMFDSSWRMDALEEMPLSEVKLPAALFVRDPVTKKIAKYEGPMPGDDRDISNIRVLVRKPWPGALVTSLPNTAPSAVSMSYIVRNQPRRGKFDAEAAKKLGIKPGPVFSALTRGEPVQNEKGETITLDQVTGETRLGHGFAVIELPSIDYIASLESSTAFTDAEVMERIEAVFWILGKDVAANIAFQKLVASRPQLKHIISSDEHCANYLSVDAAGAAQLKHREIDEQRFSIPLHDNTEKALPPALSESIIATRGIELNLEPTVKLATEMMPKPLNTIDVIEKMSKGVTPLSVKAAREIAAADFQQAYQNQHLPDEDTEIITLGTGSAVPSKQRNVSATLIRVPNVGSYLFDCGENTLGQLSRLYAPQELGEVLQDLKVVYISHMHADHHLGTVSLIRAWYTAVHGDPHTTAKPDVKLVDQISQPAKYLNNERKLFVFAEKTMVMWLQEFAEIEDYGFDRIVPIHILPTMFDEQQKIKTPTRLEWNRQTLSFNSSNPEMSVALCKATGLSDLQATYVNHCVGARAVALTWPSGLKISYSGDCRPSSRFASIGKDSTLLIHEATFDDQLSGDAKAKKHSTTGEAIGVGLAMNAKRIMLTHFSQRYSKVPELESIVTNPVTFEETSAVQAADGPPEGLEGEETDIVDSGDTEAALPQTSWEAANAIIARSSPKKTAQTLTPAQLEVAKDVKIGVAFDLMRVKLKDIMKLSKFNDAYTKLYSEPEVDEERLARQKDAEAVLQKKEEAKRVKMETHSQKQKNASKLSRKASKQSLRGVNSTIQENSLENTALPIASHFASEAGAEMSTRSAAN